MRERASERDRNRKKETVASALKFHASLDAGRQRPALLALPLPYPDPSPASASATLRFLGSATRTIKFAGSWICVVASRHNTLQCVVVVAHAMEEGKGRVWVFGSLWQHFHNRNFPTNQTKNPNRVARAQPLPAIPSALVHIKAITGHTWNLKGSQFPPPLPLCLASPPLQALKHTYA